MLEGKTFPTMNILEHILKMWLKTEERILMHFRKRNNVQGWYVFCATEITQFSTVSSFMESHSGTADKWGVYADSFMTHKLFVLCRNKAPNCYKHRSVWKHLLLLCETERMCVRKDTLIRCVCDWCKNTNSIQFHIYLLAE